MRAFRFFDEHPTPWPEQVVRRHPQYYDVVALGLIWHIGTSAHDGISQDRLTQLGEWEDALLRSDLGFWNARIFQQRLLRSRALLNQGHILLSMETCTLAEAQYRAHPSGIPLLQAADVQECMAQACRIRGNLPQALAHRELQDSLLQRLPAPDAAAVLRRLGGRLGYALVLEDAGRLAEAAAVLQTILTQCERYPAALGTLAPQAEAALAHVLMRQEKFAAADAHYDSLIARCRQPQRGMQREAAIWTATRATVKRYRQQFAPSIALSRQAMADFTALGLDHTKDMAQAWKGLGLTYLATAQSTQSQAHLDSAMRAFEQCRSIVAPHGPDGGSDSPTLFFESMVSIGQCWTLRAPHIGAATARQRAAEAFCSAANYFAQWDQGHNASDAQYFEWEQLWKNSRPQLGIMLDWAWEMYQDTGNEAWVQWALTLSDIGKGRKIFLANYLRFLQNSEASASSIPSFNDLQALTCTPLEPGQAELSYFIVDSLLYSFCKFGDHVRMQRSPYDLHFRQALLHFDSLCSTEESSIDSIHALGARLAQQLIPFPNDLGGINHLRIYPDRDLFRLRFGALTWMEGEQPRYCGEKVALSIGFSIAAQHLPHPSAMPVAGITSLEVGSLPGFDSLGLTTLIKNLWTEDELYSFADVLSKVEDRFATPTALMHALGKTQIVNLITHGDYRLEETWPFVYLAGKQGAAMPFSAAELYEMPFEIVAPMVVISACVAARGNFLPGEGIMSFAHAILLKGGMNVLCHLGYGYENANNDVLKYFYLGIKDAMPPSVALQAAQRKAIQDGNRNHPVFWSGFMVFGEDVPVQLPSRKPWGVLLALPMGMLIWRNAQRLRALRARRRQTVVQKVQEVHDIYGKYSPL